MMMMPPAAFHRPLDLGEPLLDFQGAFAAGAEALSAWAMHAGPGRGCVYARVARLPAGGVGERARLLSGNGLVTLRQRRHAPGSDLFDYAAVRTEKPFAGVRLLDEERLSAFARELMDLLVRFADAARPCPTDAELGGALGVKPSRVKSGFCELKQHGLVRLHASYRDHIPLREVEIVETGARTVLP